MPLVSIITPTFNRAELLPTIWECVRAQSFSDFEWLVLDDSPQPAPIFDAIGDARVRYMHVPNRMTPGVEDGALSPRKRLERRRGVRGGRSRPVQV
jgi:hypothetical protein